jgi:proline utilization trans-activator
MAKDSRDGENEVIDEASPVQKQLAGICVEAARKSLVILQQLRNKEILGEL